MPFKLEAGCQQDFILCRVVAITIQIFYKKLCKAFELLQVFEFPNESRYFMPYCLLLRFSYVRKICICFLGLHCNGIILIYLRFSEAIYLVCTLQHKKVIVSENESPEHQIKGTKIIYINILLIHYIIINVATMGYFVLLFTLRFQIRSKWHKGLIIFW